MTTGPSAHWTTTLATWGIPEAILSGAPQSPWIHPVQTFRPEGNLFVSTPSRLRALEALDGVGVGGRPSVLDVGCGGGRAAFGLTPPATSVVGVDHQQAMLDVFAAEASVRGLECSTILGDWPDVANDAPRCSVVTCHHVFYNVGRLEPFVRALTDHARARVVVELTQLHPLSILSGMWNHFWDLERPTSPTARDALEVVCSLGFDARMEMFDVTTEPKPITDEDVEFARIRLCLPSDRDGDIRDHLVANPPSSRALATIWWDVG